MIYHADDHPVLDLTSDAKEVYDEWYLGIERSIHARRLDVYALRLMGLLAVNDLKQEVDRQTQEEVTNKAGTQEEDSKTEEEDVDETIDSRETAATRTTTLEDNHSKE